jgi:nucleoid-associated protein YgaU
MQKRFWCVLMSVLLVAVFSGCAEIQKKLVDWDKQPAAEKQSAVGKASAADQEKSAAEAEKIAASRAAAEQEVAAKKAKKAAGDTYVVKKGDSLWKIARLKGIYGDAYLWPLLFDANKKQIKNANRIYPGQKLIIPRDGVSMDAIKKMRKKAGAKKPYTPPKTANLPMS